jgi:DNA-binding transcriptional MerR regulator
MARESRHAIGELAELAGVSRRTVRYYVQEGLLPSPLGVGRGRHYGDEHLDRLLKVKALQEQGRTLDEIRRELSGGVARAAARSVAEAEPALSREAWRRVAVAPGVELHVSARVRMPPPGKLQDLAAWCRQLFVAHEEDEETDA